MAASSSTSMHSSNNAAFQSFSLNGFSLQLPKEKDKSSTQKTSTGTTRSNNSTRRSSRPSTAPTSEEEVVLPSRTSCAEPPLSLAAMFKNVPIDIKGKQRDASPCAEIEEQDESTSVSLESGSLHSPFRDESSADTSPEEMKSSEQLDYDWATFIQAYAKGKWDPHKPLRPPRLRPISHRHSLYAYNETPSSIQTAESKESTVDTDISDRSIQGAVGRSTPASDPYIPIRVHSASPAPTSPSDLSRGRLSFSNSALSLYRQRNSFSAASSTTTNSSPSVSNNAELQASAATLRWAAARVNLSPLALPSPEHELTDPMRGVNAAIPGSHPPNYVAPNGQQVTTPPGTWRARPSGFWKGTQDVDSTRLPTIDASPDDEAEDLSIGQGHDRKPQSPTTGVPPTVPPASAPLHGSQRLGADYFGSAALNHETNLGSPPSTQDTPRQASQQSSAPRRDSPPNQGALTVPAVPRRVCLTRQTSSPLPSSSSSNDVDVSSMIPYGRGLNSESLVTQSGRAAKEEQMYNELGYLAPPNPPDELDRRRALYKYNIWRTGPDLNFDRIAHLAKLVFHTKGVLVSLVDGNELFYKSEWGLKAHSCARTHSFCAHAILQRGDEPMVVLDSHSDWRFQGNPLVTGPPNIRFYAGAPLRTQDGFNIGTLAVVDSSPRDDFSPRQRHTLKEFAAIVMREMELWRDKIQLRIRDRIQNSMEQFTRECLEIDSEAESRGSEEYGDLYMASMDKVYDHAARLVKRTLDVEGVMVMDVSHCEVLENTVTADGTVAVAIHTDGPQASTTRSLTPEEYGKINTLFANYPDGKIFEGVAPVSFRPFLPARVQYALTVPIFNVDKRPFALLCAYNSEGGTTRFLEGHELSYLRAIGVIILSAVLKRRMTLADKAKSLFISNISHELRTPLHGILAAAELLQESELNHSQRSFLETVQACGASLVETVNHVLDFTKLSGNSKAGGVENVIVPTKVDLLHLVEDALDGCFVGYRARTAESGIGSVYSPPKEEGNAPAKLVETVVDIGLPLESWFVECEKGGIRRVLMNLFSNSLKFTSNGYVHVSLTQLPRSADMPPDQVRIELSVTDTGKGISDDFLKNQLFHPFTQENPLQTGTGLGLAIVNSIIKSDSVRGKLDVWSEEGVGTEIKVSFLAKTIEPQDGRERVAEPFKLDALKEIPTVSLVGFDQSHQGVRLLQQVLKTYIVSWWGLVVLPVDDDSGQIIIVNNDISPIVAAIEQRDVRRPFIIFTEVRGNPNTMAIANEYESIGGFCRILYKPAGPSRLRPVLKLCIHALKIAAPASFATEPDENARRDMLVSGHLPRRKSEENHPVRPSLMPRSVTTHPLTTSWRYLPSTEEVEEPTSRPSSEMDITNEDSLTIPVGAGGTLLQSSVSKGVSQGRFRVLVVEDNHILRDLLIKWLKKKGYEYRSANDGRDGVRVFQSEGPFDVVLLDLSMPVLDGVGATAEMRQLESESGLAEEKRQRPTRILALTGMSSLEDKRRAFDAGVDGYLVKPVAFRTLDEIFAKLGFSS